MELLLTCWDKCYDNTLLSAVRNSCHKSLQTSAVLSIIWWMEWLEKKKEKRGFYYRKCLFWKICFICGQRVFCHAFSLILYIWLNKNANSKIQILKIVTAKLLPAFVGTTSSGMTKERANKQQLVSVVGTYFLIAILIPYTHWFFCFPYPLADLVHLQEMCQLKWRW